MAPFLRNQWYTAATSAELGDKPLAHTICNEPLVIFRSGDGNVAVLTDRSRIAKHRFHPAKWSATTFSAAITVSASPPTALAPAFRATPRSAAVSGQEVSQHTKSMG